MDFQNWLTLQERRGEYNANNVIVVDVQETYEDYIPFNLTEFTQYLLQMLRKKRQILYFYNGQNTVGHENTHDIVNWLTEKALNRSYREWEDDEEYEQELAKFEQIAQTLQGCQWYDKGYGFFRDWMDEGVEDRQIVKFIRYMYQHRIERSDDIPEEAFENLAEGENLPGTIYLPHFTVEMVRRYNGAHLVGGGVTTCLREVQLLMNAFNIRHTVFRKFTY